MPRHLPFSALTTTTTQYGFHPGGYGYGKIAYDF
ncbi:hypothetical protein SAMN05444352_13320 [Pseudomonas japonica]|uniref:Uncharacterized protein n=1 Tax=Pseudomonas japonica TaxID=256466 RepID=A0A239L9U3_9PSED|nr:hypothetical protein SAMN05444352_13320 [Pseudomonas japonica]